MRIRDYYSRVVRGGRDGAPTFDEARHDYRRDLENRYRVFSSR